MTYARLGEGQCAELCSGQAGGRRQSPHFCITIRPPCHLMKPTPCLGFEHLKMERNVTGQNLRFPWRFDYLQIHIRLTYHSPLICQHLNLFGCRVSDENLKAMLICTACGTPLPGPLCPGKARAHVHILMYPNRRICALVHTLTTTRLSLKKHIVLCADLMGSHGLRPQTLAKKRRDPTHP